MKKYRRVYPKNIKVSGVIWEKNDDEVHLFPVTIIPSPNRWRVVTQKNREMTSKRDFKTKTQALKYARSYINKDQRTRRKCKIGLAPFKKPVYKSIK